MCAELTRSVKLVAVILAVLLMTGNICAYAAEPGTLNKGLEYMRKGAYNEAIGEFDKALEAEPRNDEIYSSRGLAYANKGDHDQAIEDYTKAISINPKNAEAYYNRSVAYFFNKDYEPSLKDAMKADALEYKVNPAYIEDLKKRVGKRSMVMPGGGR